MDKPKILMGLTYYLPNISGVTQYAVILAEELVKRKYKVEVICSGNHREINGVKINGVPGFGLGKGFIMPQYALKSFALVKRNDVVLLHVPSVESLWLAIWGRLFNKKVIVIHHCEFNFTGTISNKIISLITYPIHLAIYALANVITSYTEDYAKTSVFLKMFKEKIKFILPPIKVEESKLELDFGKGKVVGFVGRIGWEKGLEYLIKAMKDVKAKLILVGPYKEVVGDDTFNKLKGSQNVLFYGPMAHKDVKSFYSKIDCLVLPSTNNLETFGIVQAEAMVCGVPVVASNLPGVRVPVKMTKMGEISRVADSADLARKIKTVLRHGKKYYQNLAENIVEFNYIKTVDTYELILVADR